jgi:hypothetical protein
MDWQRLGCEIVRDLFGGDGFRAIERAHDNPKLRLMYEADGSWGGAKLVHFSMAELNGVCIWNTEANSRDLQLTRKEIDVYGTFQLGLLYNPDAPVPQCWQAIQKNGPGYGSDWSWWSSVNRCLFEWCRRDAWMFHVAGTILQGIDPQPACWRHPQASAGESSI